MLHPAKTALLITNYIKQNPYTPHDVKQQEQELVRAAQQLPIQSSLVTPHEHPYAVLGIDGSQIYPDRHRGNPSLFLLNIGGCGICYAEQNSKAYLFSDPQLYDINALCKNLGDQIKPSALVDLERELVEYTCYRTTMKQFEQQSSQHPFLCLIDGSLLLYGISNLPEHIRMHFLSRFLSIFESFRQEQLLHAAYTSLPQNRDLIRMITGNKHTDTDYTDTDLMLLLLQTGQRTELYSCSQSTENNYPAHLKPWFFYLHTGHEIGRIEVPRWLAEQEHHIATISSIILDQCRKGLGYPVVLAEAHQQAVVTKTDQELFYHMLEQTGVNTIVSSKPSQKLLKKRRLSM